ncbi:MAG: HypC/HybG/HupF family hydrogenase formation chaperone [Bacteroidota bacterium]
MCLSIPAEVISIEGDTAKVTVGGAVREASLQLLEEVKVGDFVLLHTGFAIEVISPEEAEETMRYLRELGEVSPEDKPLF